jgi:hypothetical protein
MPTVLCDAIEHAGPPLTSNRHRELLAEGFGPEADFYLNDGIPYVVYPMWDCADYWGQGLVRNVHPFAAVINGLRITEEEFRVRVRELHGV